MRGLFRVRLLGCAFLLAAWTSTGWGQAENSAAFRALERGRVDEATGLLQARLARNPNDAVAHQLLCRAAYMQEMADVAVQECRTAVQADPTNGESEMWLGRALGMQAGRVNKIVAFTLARQVRTAFEQAVQLNPGDVRAASDLGQFYVAAPAIVGGGSAKARRLAGQMAERFPSQSHWLLGLLEQENGDLPGAERELKTAVAVGKSAQTYIDLGLFYQQHGRADEAAAAVIQGLALDRSHGPVSVDAASILTDANRMPELAERALREYLAGDGQTDGAPAFKVHLQLGRMLSKRGDRAGAKQEFAAAAAMASRYEPARAAMQGS